MTTSFTAKEVKLLRRNAAKASETPRDGPNGWSKSTVDPMMVLAVFKPLRLKDGYTLRAYQFRHGGNGNGVVWAMPVDADFPDPETCPRLEDDFLEPPKPPAALDDVMDAVDGDGTPWSYLCSSILARELGEFGAIWHGCAWSTHKVLGEAPWRERRSLDGQRSMGSKSAWQWQATKPKEWNPLVSKGSNVLKVTFITHSGLSQETIYRHIDTYKSGTYRFKSVTKAIAVGPGGCVF